MALEAWSGDVFLTFSMQVKWMNLCGFALSLEFNIENLSFLLFSLFFLFAFFQLCCTQLRSLGSRRLWSALITPRPNEFVKNQKGERRQPRKRAITLFWGSGKVVPIPMTTVLNLIQGPHCRALLRIVATGRSASTMSTPYTMWTLPLVNSDYPTIHTAYGARKYNIHR